MLFAAHHLRLDVHGEPEIDGLTLELASDKAILFGAPRVLFLATIGLRTITRGDIRILGNPPQTAAKRGDLAGVLFRAPLPASWSIDEYAVWSARLAGHSTSRARALAAEAISALRLSEYAALPLGKAALHVQAAASLAAALATGARVLVMEDPSDMFPEATRRSLAHLFCSALNGRKWLLFAGRMPLSSPFALQADEAVMLSGSVVVSQGAVAELASRERAYVMQVAGDQATFVSILQDHEAKPKQAGARLTIELPSDTSTNDLFRWAAEANAVILTLQPIAAVCGSV